MKIENKISKQMALKKTTLCTAESCTGGLLAHRITNVSGSSQFFKCGLITYSNQSKIQYLRITPKILKRYGAVSQEVAMAMAKNLKKRQRCHMAVGITGIAGPTGGTKLKPVGLIFIAIAYDSQLTAHRYLFKGSREHIKKQASTKALQLIYDAIR